MQAMGHITSYVRTKTVWNRQKISQISNVEKPYSFCISAPNISLFSQTNAWSDEAIVHQWLCTVFVASARHFISIKVVLLIEECFLHRENWIDCQTQNSIIMFLSSCSYLQRLTNMESIQACQKKYEVLMPQSMTSDLESRQNLGDDSIWLRSVMPGIANKHDSQTLQIAEMVFKS